MLSIPQTIPCKSTETKSPLCSMPPARPELKFAQNVCNEFIRLVQPALLQQRAGKERKRPNPQQISVHVVGLHQKKKKKLKTRLCRGMNLLFSPWLPPSHVTGTWRLAQMARRGTQRACQLSGTGTQVLMLALAARCKPDLQETASEKGTGASPTSPFLSFKIKQRACAEWRITRWKYLLKAALRDA